ncbi:MAG: CoA-binding protein, partial [Halioglobus sp.]
MSKHYLESVFNPASVAVVCDEAYSNIGRQVLQNLKASDYQGAVYAVMPTGSGADESGHELLGSVADIGQPLELVVIAAKADAQPAILRQCGECK